MQINEKITKVIPLQNTSQTKQYNYLNYPILNGEAQSQTFKNYLKFATRYNEAARIADKEILEYNDNLVQCTETELQAALHFMNIRKGLPVQQYNTDVLQFNAMFQKVLVPQKRIPKLGAGHKNAFEALVTFQAGQLNHLTKTLHKFSGSARMLKNELPEIEATYHELLNVKDENGSSKYHIECKRSVQNHLNRLEEVGAITRTFCGSTHPFKVKINPEILLVLDGNQPKQQTQQNRALNSKNAKILPDKDITTRTINNNRIKSDEKISSIIQMNGLSPLIASFPAESYRVTSGISKESFSTGRGLLAQNLTENLIKPNEFAEKLANNEFVNYQVPSKNYYKKLLYNSNVTREEMKHFLLQDLLKQASKIWQNHEKLSHYNKNAMIGSWANTIIEFNDYYLVDQGTQTTYTKEHLYKLMEQFRWRIKIAANCFKKENWFALFPSQYFDRMRKSPADVAFQGTRFMWDRHQTNQAAKQTNLQKRIAEAKERKEIARLNNLYKTAIQKYVFGKKDKIWLINYVSRNLPNHYSANLGKNVNEYREKIAKKAA